MKYLYILLIIAFSGTAFADKIDDLLKRPPLDDNPAPTAENATTSSASKGSAALPSASGTTVPVLPPSSEDQAPTLREEAFKQLINKMLPLTPEQIIEMRKQQDRSQQAVATTPKTPPRAVSSTQTVELSPGATPPVIRLSQGFVTTLVFVDSTGQPWPIADYSLGNPKQFNLQWDRKTNTIFMQSLSAYSSGNLAVRLDELDTPITLSLVSGQREVDYRADMQIQALGPNALPTAGSDAVPNAPPTLLSVLDGVPPVGSQELQLSMNVGKIWLANGKLIFRSQFPILSPAWLSTVSSPDGTKVYELSKTPLILISQNGKPVKVEVKGL